MSEKPNVVGEAVTCTVCGSRKQPIGRSAPLDSYLCDSDCPGHRQDPWPGWLWPGETQQEFGYCLDCGTPLTGENGLDCPTCTKEREERADAN